MVNPLDSRPAPPLDLEPHRTALFLDCDGTLCEFADHPADARIQPAITRVVAKLARASGGAVALISGRSLAQIDILSAPIILPAAGVHGAERRDASGRVRGSPVDDAIPPGILDRIEALAAANPGIVSEAKPASVARHYRMRPELEVLVHDMMSAVARSSPGLKVMLGKQVIELTASSRTKGDAIADFMNELPFAGRLPVFIGDDVTDENGFMTVAKMGGIGIKIGHEPTTASHVLPGIRDFHVWLGKLAMHWEDMAS